MKKMKLNLAYEFAKNRNCKIRKAFPTQVAIFFFLPRSHKLTLPRGLRITTHIFMVHTLHEDQLPVSSLGMRLVLKWSAELLNGHISVKGSIICGTAEIQE